MGTAVDAAKDTINEKGRQKSKEGVNERSMSWLTIATTLFVLRFVASEALFEKPFSKNGELIFRPVLGMRIIFGLGIPGSLFAVVRFAQTENIRNNWFLFLFGLSIPIFAIALAPSIITVNKLGISEQKWFGLKKTSINWSGVAYVFSSPSERLFTIAGEDGKQIKHTAYHVDREALRESLKHYCQKYYGA